MIFSLLIVHNHNRMSSITRVHTTTWDYFSSHLPDGFDRSPKVVKDAIITDIDDLVEEFRRTSSDVGASFFAMRRLLSILQNILEVCFDNISPFLRLAEKNLQRLTYPSSQQYSLVQSDDGIRAKITNLLDGYQKMFDQSLCKSKDLGDMLRFLPGVVVQKEMSVQGMADLYRIKPDLLQCLIESTIEPLRPYPGHNPYSPYKLEHYLSRFLWDRDRSQLYYCDDPMLQHISISRRVLSLLDGSNALSPQT